MAQRDVIDLIQADHQEFRTLFDSIDTIPPDQREDLFRTLVAELARHEAAEEALVHRALRDDVPDGESVAEQVLEEESGAERLLADMEKMDPTSSDFLDAFIRLRDDVIGHADHEEREEHPRLREQLDEQQLRDMADKWERLKDMGPTRPHPRTPQSPEVRGAVGPIAGVFDRARDRARQMLSG